MKLYYGMGTARFIEAYSVYEGYNPNPDDFLSALAKKLNASFVYSIYDSEDNCICENKDYVINSSSKIAKYSLDVEYRESDIEPVYDLKIPILHEIENFLNFKFYPNNVILVRFLTFDFTWKDFIETLKFGSSNTQREKVVNSSKALRNQYIPILRKLGIDSILIATHANYKIENVIESNEYTNMSYEEILEIATKKDKLSFFNLIEIFDAINLPNLDRKFLKEKLLKIGFVDNV